MIRCYKAEKDTKGTPFIALAFLILVIGIAIVLNLEFSDIGKQVFVAFAVALLSVVSFVIGYVLNRPCYKFRSWLSYMKKHGTKCKGKVIDVVKQTSEKYGETYHFKVEYKSKLNDSKSIYTTPALVCAVSNDNIGSRCDVYEVEGLDGFKYKLGTWMGEVAADNFDRIKKLKEESDDRD